MPTRLPGRRAVGRGGNLKPRERECIEKWFVEGLTVVEVYARCLDEGIEPPIEHALYKILNSDVVQEGLRQRRAAESRKSIASLAARTASRQKLLGKIEALIEARADAYTALAPGGDTGLVVLTDRKSVLVGKDADGRSEYQTLDVFKADTALLEQLRGVLADQEKSDAALRKNLRGEEREDQEAELREQAGSVRDLERQRAELEMEQKRLAIEKERLELEKLRAEVEAIKRGGGSYQPPSFPSVIVERLPVPERPEMADDDQDDDEGATPAIPLELMGEEPQ